VVPASKPCPLIRSGEDRIHFGAAEKREQRVGSPLGWYRQNAIGYRKVLNVAKGSISKE
jgi:hypothetical protein